MSRKTIWLVSLILSAIVWFGVREWKPYLFGEMLSGSMIRQLNLNDAVTWEPAALISVLLVGFTFLLFSNLLHALFYQRRLLPKRPSSKSDSLVLPRHEQSGLLQRSSDIDTEEHRIREQLLRRANRIDRKS